MATTARSAASSSPVISLAATFDHFQGVAQHLSLDARYGLCEPSRAAVRSPSKPHTPPYTVWIVGRSQGSRAINRAVMASLPLLAAGSMEIRIVHQTGEPNYNEVRKTYEEQGLLAEVHAFIKDMPEAFARADLVVSRAGAVAVTELAAAGRAALLIPFPGATDQHQLENARVFERAGAARVIVQSDLTPQRLVDEVGGLLSAPEKLVQMENQARLLAKPGAAGRIADLVEQLAARTQQKLQRGPFSASRPSGLSVSVSCGGG